MTYLHIPKPTLSREGRGRRKKPRLTRRRSRKKYERAKLLELVRLEIPKKQWVWHYVSKEEIAHKLNAKESDVAWCLHRLNLEGLVEQPIHRAPHDTNRDRMFGFPNYPGWGCDMYLVRSQDDQDLPVTP